MAYIQPDGQVQFFADLGLDSNYENTLYFSSTQSKDSYFDSVTKITTATALSYSRAERGFIRVEKPMSTMINAGYMRFKNSSFENKWFYAFVKNVEYINHTTTQVNFELDVMMTWMGSFSLNQCYIERQHVASDGIGENIVGEGLELGNYVCENSEAYNIGPYDVVLYKSYNEDKGDVRPGNIQQGTYDPLVNLAFPLDSTNIGLLEALLDAIVDDNRENEIVTLKLAPEKFITNGTTVPEFTVNIAKPYSQIGGSATYTVRNKKLFTYPFKYLQVENCEGKQNVYKYEYFNTLPTTVSSGNCSFKVYGSCCTPEINVMCVPTSYNGVNFNWSEATPMESFPTLAYNVDGYKAYLAQRDSTIYGNIGASMLQGAIVGGLRGFSSGSVVGGVMGALLGGMTGTIANAGAGTLLSDTINDMKSGELPERMPNETKGYANTNLTAQLQEKKFFFRKMSITIEYARMIDDFFDMYGYAIKRVATPQMNVRPNWTYVKTKGCSLDGSLPADDAATIENIFDSGIRFWKNHANIGNYSLANSPT